VNVAFLAACVVLIQVRKLSQEKAAVWCSILLYCVGIKLFSAGVLPMRPDTPQGSNLINVFFCCVAQT
jgi:hypothetical protein